VPSSYLTETMLERYPFLLSKHRSDSLSHLLKDCEPASFGRGNQKVIDEGYRQASTLDIQKFSSDYSPYDNRVMEKVSQALAFRDVADNSHRGLRAELYKMNVNHSSGLCLTLRG
jgi:hypothetical protein